MKDNYRISAANFSMGVSRQNFSGERMLGHCRLRGAAFGAALLLIAAGALAAPYSFDATPGRLPKDVVPIDYAIEHHARRAALTIAGQESVLLEFRRAAATLRFDSLNEQLTDVRLDGKPVSSTVSDDDAAADDGDAGCAGEAPDATR